MEKFIINEDVDSIDNALREKHSKLEGSRHSSENKSQSAAKLTKKLDDGGKKTSKTKSQKKDKSQEINKKDDIFEKF